MYATVYSSLISCAIIQEGQLPLQTPFRNCRWQRKECWPSDARCKRWRYRRFVSDAPLFIAPQTDWSGWETLTSAYVRELLTWNWDHRRTTCGRWRRWLCISDNKCWVSPTGHLWVYWILRFRDWIGPTKSPRASEFIFNLKKSVRFQEFMKCCQ
jgi:hypothetical protein